MTYPDGYPNENPGRVEPTAAMGPPVEDPEQRRWDRLRKVRTANTIVRLVCGLFAVVLVAYIIMVLGEANPANGLATFTRGFAGAVSLGFDGLFTPDSAKAQVLLNYGCAALVWVALGAVVTYLIRRFALPGPRGPLDLG